jgi:sodium pump decarboxylase gamma subunit
MSVPELLITGLELTVIGMVTVFLLLTSMVFVIQWMSRLAHRLQPPQRPRHLKSTHSQDGALDPALISAIGAAVHRYRNKRR